MSKLFLDDIRNPKDCLGYMHTRIGKYNPMYLDEDWLIVRNYEEFVDAIKQHYESIEIISFDHDLAVEHYASPDIWEYPDKVEERFDTFKEKTGYECAIYSKVFYEVIGVAHPTIWVHSMNPVGTERIKSLFQ